METTVTATRLSALLKQQTRTVHDALDRSVMEAAPLEDLAGYGTFVTMQWAFHSDIAPLYRLRALQALLPGLEDRCRLDLIRQDLLDLDLLPPAFVPAGPDGTDSAEALGWLYVAEGSNMGAALLRRQVAKLGVSDRYGARHLAPAAEGPAAHWRAFTAALDAIALDDGERDRAVAGAERAFARVRQHADTYLR